MARFASGRLDGSNRDDDLIVRIVVVELARGQIGGHHRVEKRARGQHVAIGFDRHIIGTEHIAEQPPQAIINTKALLKAKNHDAVAAVMKAEFEIFAMALQSEEAMEAFMKFMSKKGK